MPSVIREATNPATRGSESVAAMRRENGSERMMPRAVAPTTRAAQTEAAPTIKRIVEVRAERAGAMPNDAAQDEGRLLPQGSMVAPLGLP